MRSASPSQANNVLQAVPLRNNHDIGEKKMCHLYVPKIYKKEYCFIVWKFFWKTFMFLHHGVYGYYALFIMNTILYVSVKMGNFLVFIRKQIV